jgi:hypothetical protein
LGSASRTKLRRVSHASQWSEVQNKRPSYTTPGQLWWARLSSGRRSPMATAIVRQAWVKITSDRPRVMFGAFVIQNRSNTVLLDTIVAQLLCWLVMGAKSVLGAGSGWVFYLAHKSSKIASTRCHLGPTRAHHGTYLCLWKEVRLQENDGGRPQEPVSGWTLPDEFPKWPRKDQIHTTSGCCPAHLRVTKTSQHGGGFVVEFASTHHGRGNPTSSVKA